MTSAASARRVQIAPLTAAVALLLVVLDQLTKWWAVRRLDDGDIDIVWTLRLNLSYNTGAAFGSGQSWGPVIAVLAMVIVVGLLVSLRRGNSRAADVAVGVILGGAVGNLLDRIFREPRWLRGGVVDFIDFQWFPIFNVADMGITIGGALLLISSWFLTSHRGPSETAGS